MTHAVTITIFSVTYKAIQPRLTLRVLHCSALGKLIIMTCCPLFFFFFFLYTPFFFFVGGEATLSVQSTLALQPWLWNDTSSNGAILCIFSSGRNQWGIW